MLRAHIYFQFVYIALGFYKKVYYNINILNFFILFFYLVGYGVYYILSEPVRNIIISGTTYINDADVIEVAGLKNYPAYSSLRNSKLKKKIKVTRNERPVEAFSTMGK